MPIRPLDLLDLPTLYRYRSAVLSLDSTRALTHGNPLSLGSLLVHLDPARRFYSAIHIAEEGDNPSLVGGITQDDGETCARLSFLAPPEATAGESILALLDHLTAQAGDWGVHHLLAEVEEQSPLYPIFRKAGFVVYAWQRIWSLGDIPTEGAPPAQWRKARPEDLPTIQTLHRHIVPALLQVIEPPFQRAEGMILQNEEGLHGYVGMRRGPRGVLLQPLIHPDTGQVTERLRGLLQSLPRHHGGGVHLCMRSYQAWLEPVLRDLGASAGTRQAVMVRHLVASQRQEALAQAKAEGAWARPATPIVRTHTRVPLTRVETIENESIAHYR